MDAGIIFKGEQPLFILTAYTEHVPAALPDGTPGFAAAYSSSAGWPASAGTRWPNDGRNATDQGGGGAWGRSGRRSRQIRIMAPKAPPAPKRAMSIHAHPDDQEFTVGGTLAKWARAGCEIITVCITSGGAGSNKYTPPDMTRRALVAIREEEQREAGRILGVKDTIFLSATRTACSSRRSRCGRS